MLSKSLDSENWINTALRRDLFFSTFKPANGQGLAIQLRCAAHHWNQLNLAYNNLEQSRQNNQQAANG